MHARGEPIVRLLISGAELRMIPHSGDAKLKNALFALLTIGTSSAACAQVSSAADQVADQFLADDRQKPPSDPKLAKDFEFLNQCSAKRIRASDIAFGDSREVITAKVHAAMDQCVKDLYGRK